MTRVRNDATGYIAGDRTHDFGHLHPERMLAAECKYRHGQFALLSKQFVVGRILREGRELIKCRMHGAGARVEPSIMAPCRLIDRLRIGGKLVPEPVQVNAFAALDEPLNVRPAEIEVPQSHTCRKLCS